MASLSTRPNPDHLSQCFTIVRWLHAKGISWSGTASELSLQLAKDPDAKLWFSDADEVVAFLESNVEALRQLGLEASVRRFPGRPRLIDLQLHADEMVFKPGASLEVVRPLPVEDDIAPIREGEATEAKTVEEAYVPRFANKPEFEPVKSVMPGEPAHRLFTLLGVSAEEAVPQHAHQDVVEEKFAPRFGVFADKVNYEEERERLLPLAIACLVLFVVIVTFVLVVRKRAEAPNPVVVTNPTASTETASAPPIDPEEATKTQALLQEASVNRSPSQQYELAMRYESGLGVQQDRATAYAWLTLARANGSTRAPSMIRNLGERLSSAEMQRARILVGKAFASGLSVPRSYVVAHNWLSLADLAGSAEARTLKKQLEAKMSPEQIRRASTQSGSR